MGAGWSDGVIGNPSPLERVICPNRVHRQTSGEPAWLVQRHQIQYALASLAQAASKCAQEKPVISDWPVSACRLAGTGFKPVAIEL